MMPLLPDLLGVRQEAGDDAEEGQERTDLEDELDAGLVGEPAEEGGTQAAQSEHQAEEDAGNQSHLVGHQVGGVDHDGREGRGDDEAGEEGADEGPREVDEGHGEGEGGGSQDGEPYHVLPPELVAQHASRYCSDGKGGKEDEEAELGGLHGNAELVHQEEREVAGDAGRIEILREDQQDENHQGSVLGPLGDVVVEERLPLRMVDHIGESRLIPSAQPNHEDGGHQCCQGKP